MSGDIEAIVLTGGASRRMGVDKASIELNGVSQAQRIVDQLSVAGYPVTVIGREPVGEARFLQDACEFPGPLVALNGFRPRQSKVMVLSCDIPLFQTGIIRFLDEHLDEPFDAALPEIDGRVQPLLGLYRARCWEQLSRHVIIKERRMMAWIETLGIRIVAEQEIVHAGIDKFTLMSANSPQELQQLLSETLQSP